jgi:hypothetical protein
VGGGRLAATVTAAPHSIGTGIDKSAGQRRRSCPESCSDQLATASTTTTTAAMESYRIRGARGADYPGLARRERLVDYDICQPRRPGMGIDRTRSKSDLSDQT